MRDGIAGARSSSQHIKSGSSVTLGPIDDIAAPISSSPTIVPPVKSESIKQFGSVQASPSSSSFHLDLDFIAID
ncbi:hypothetical protein A0H81_10250 [Grifola frondosa]|uniref:Uncharacterized protein n=1 Tax=Grifola frondosa TaxID=5627 RepID=A0A1C7M099_GRIFR|nr:hypothetical protein A0H81_10250 [Grifola frondosa]